MSLDPLPIDAVIKTVKSMKKTRVLLAQPHYSSYIHGGAAQAAYLHATDGACWLLHADLGSSLLALGFNRLWITGLDAFQKGYITHFAMLHSDISCQQGWLDILVAELKRLDADVVSAVVPLKDQSGETSTALDGPDSPWAPLRRLHLKEIAELPQTFCAADTDAQGALLINTGCWVCDLRKPWVHATNPDGTTKMRFTVNDEICQTEDAKGVKRWRCRVESEDWEFSRFLHREGARVYATSKVALQHNGEMSHTNVVRDGVNLLGNGQPLDNAMAHGANRVEGLVPS